MARRKQQLKAVQRGESQEKAEKSAGGRRASASGI